VELFIDGGINVLSERKEAGSSCGNEISTGVELYILPSVLDLFLVVEPIVLFYY